MEKKKEKNLLCKQIWTIKESSIGKLVLLFCFFVFFLIHQAKAQEKYNGEIFSLLYSPSNPIVLEEVKINVGIENTGTEYSEYELKLFVSKEGQIKYTTTISFDLQPGKAIFFSPTYTPNDIRRI